jgi:hypothetical protein
MLTAVAAGVYFSIQIGVGYAARQNPSFTWWVVNRLAFLVGATNMPASPFTIQGRLGLPGEHAVGPTRWLLLIVGVFILLDRAEWRLTDRFGASRWSPSAV